MNLIKKDLKNLEFHMTSFSETNMVEKNLVKKL